MRTFAQHLAAFAIAALAMACGNDASTPPPPPPPGPAITGMDRVIHWDDAGGSTAVGQPPIDLFIEAQLAADDVRPARIASDGTFAIDGDAPGGRYWLRVVDPRLGPEDVYVFTDATQIDLGRDVVGAHHDSSADARTQVIVDAGGLSTWQDGDDGDFVMPALGWASSVITFFSSNGPTAGATSFDAVTYSWQGEPLSAQPGAADFVQVRPAHDDALALDYVAPVKTFHSDAFSIADAATVHVAGAFVDPPALDVPLHWNRSAFAALAGATHPAGCQGDLDFETYWVHALPDHGAHGDFERSAVDPLAALGDYGPRVVDQTFASTSDDLDGTLHVANPYPRAWLLAKYSTSFVLSCALPGDRIPGNAEAEIAVITDDLGTTPIVPMIGPVGAPVIAGSEVRWTAPSIGTPTSYELHLNDVATLGGPSLHEGAVLYVPGDLTSITLPRELLLAGTTYTIRIRAVAQPGQSIATAPFRAGVPYAYADVFTDYFQP